MYSMSDSFEINVRVTRELTFYTSAIFEKNVEASEIRGKILFRTHFFWYI